MIKYIFVFLPLLVQAQSVHIYVDSPRQNRTTFSVSLVDCFFKGKASAGNYRDVTALPYLDYVRALGYKHLLYPADGSIAQKHHAPIAGGSGYHLLRSDFPSDDAYNSYNGGVATVQWPSSFAVDARRLADSIGAVIDYVANVRNGSADEDRWFIDYFRPQYIKWGSELLIDWDPVQYVAAVLERSANINNIYHVIDAGLVWRTGHRKTVQWNNSVATLPLPEADTYWQLGDRVQLGPDMARNADIVKDYFDTILPNDMQLFNARFPGKRLFVGQMNIEDTRDDASGAIIKHIDNTMLATYAIARYYEYALNNTEDISYVCWQSLRNLIDRNDQRSNNYYALQLCNKMQAATHIGRVSLPDGMNGVVGWNDSIYMLLLANHTDRAFNNINMYINNKNITQLVTFNIDARWATGWDDSIRHWSTVSNTISIQPYSVTVVTFDKHRADRRPLIARIISRIRQTIGW